MTEKFLKLAEIDGTKLAVETIQRALDHIYSMLFALAPLGDARIVTGDPAVPFGAPERDAVTASNVGEAVVMLTSYAQRGDELDAPVQEYAITLIPVAGDALDDATTPDPSTELGLVVAAALGREAIDEGQPISTTRLAILGGVSPQRIRQLIAAGELSADKGNEVAAVDAKRWLSSRGVKGF